MADCFNYGGRTYQKQVLFDKIRNSPLHFAKKHKLTGFDVEKALGISVADGGNTDFSFIGEKGAKNLGNAMNSMVMVKSFEAAVKAEKEGISKEEIHQKTGWHKGADGKWKFELDYDVKQKSPNFNKNSNGNPETTLGELVDYPTLFAAYPELNNSKVILTDFGHNLSNMSEANGNIYLNARIYSTDNNGKLTSTLPLGDLLHEQQHIIQGIEGFSRGGEPRRIANIILDEIHGSGDQYGSDNERKGIIAEVQRIFGNNWKEEIKGWTDPEQVKKLSTDIYERLGGEVEARNVANRLKLSAEQRIANSPEFTESVDRNIQIQIEAGFGENQNIKKEENEPPQRPINLMPKSLVNAIATTIRDGGKKPEVMNVIEGSYWYKALGEKTRNDLTFADVKRIVVDSENYHVDNDKFKAKQRANKLREEKKSLSGKLKTKINNEEKIVSVKEAIHQTIEQAQKDGKFKIITKGSLLVTALND